MIKKIIITLFSLIIFNTKSDTIIYEKPQKAVCVVPICDLICFSFNTLTNNQKAKEHYNKIAISGYKGNHNCVRDHQILFNETVEVLEEYYDEIKINIKNAFVQNYGTTYWTLKENFIKAEDLDQNKIPKQIDFKENNFTDFYENNVTLVLPFYDNKTNKTYSAGTRFIYKYKDMNNYTVYIYDPNDKNYIESIVTKKLCLDSQKLDKYEKIKNFIKVLKSWTTLENDQILPFAWGGCSFIDKIKSHEFILTEDLNHNNETIHYWTREELTRKPYAGFDASGLMLRAAQICEIPYFFKNTMTCSQFLKTMAKNEIIEEGDLIWFPGYLAAISDIKNNLVIGGRGYQHGYGKIVEQPLKDLFLETETFEQLREAYFNKKSLTNIDKNGQINRTIYEFKILKLSSCWEIEY